MAMGQCPPGRIQIEKLDGTQPVWRKCTGEVAAGDDHAGAPPAIPETVETTPTSVNGQFLSDGGGRISDFRNNFLQFLMGDVEMLRPVADLVGFIHIDFAAVRLISFGEIVGHCASPCGL
jgi:hypothetical protein